MSRIGKDRFRIGFTAAPENDDGFDGLAPYGIGHGDDRDLLHRGVTVDRAFNLGGINVLPARHDHVFDAILHIDVAITIHEARIACGAEAGIRVNVVNPDAVIRGSRIWDGDWRKERASAYGVDSGEELEEFYRKRSLLKRNVLPEDVAEAIYFFASDASAKSTGNIINVDAGNAQAFTR